MSIDGTNKRRGRPATGLGIQIQVRMQPADVEKLDAWREQQTGDLTRPEAIRAILKEKLDG